LRIGFKIAEKNYQFMLATQCSVNISTLTEDFQMERTELQSDIQLKNMIMSLLDLYKHSLIREIYPSLHNHTSFMLSLFRNKYIPEQLFSRMKHRKIKISSKISDKHLESSLRIAATAIKPV